jgi:hypothetical protein
VSQSELEKIRERVRKLLRLAHSPNVNEAATAAAFAQELMVRYRLESIASENADHIVDEPIAAYLHEALESSKRLRAWKIELAAVLAASHACRIFVGESQRNVDPENPQSKRESVEQIIVVGRRTDFENLREFYEPLVKMVESLTRAHGAGRDRKWCDGFRFGVVATLRDRLREANAKAESEACARPALGETTQGLVLRARVRERLEVVSSWMEENLRLTRGKAGPKVLVAAYDHGRLAGQSLALGTVGNRNRKK